MTYADQADIFAKIDPKLRNKYEKIKIATEEPPDPNSLENFGIEYSISCEDMCAMCQELIPRNELRIKKVVYDTETAAKYGKEVLWNHYYCFIMQRDYYGFRLSGEMLPGFQTLRQEHQNEIRESLR